jgi:hypothetical protein
MVANTIHEVTFNIRLFRIPARDCFAALTGMTDCDTVSSADITGQEGKLPAPSIIQLDYYDKHWFFFI